MLVCVPQHQNFAKVMGYYYAHAELTLIRSRLTSLRSRSATANTAFTQISAIVRFSLPTLQEKSHQISCADPPFFRRHICSHSADFDLELHVEEHAGKRGQRRGRFSTWMTEWSSRSVLRSNQLCFACISSRLLGIHT